MIRRLIPGARSDEGINVALYHLRAQIVREGLDGLEHVDALLKLRGVDPESLHIPEKRHWRYRRGEFRIAVIEALREGPKTAPQIARELDHNHACVCRCLRTLEGRGVVQRDGRVWLLATLAKQIR
ncbi:helix-turn-helix domain-containing protein [Marivita sp.]|uniref:helix-turn-helix domain-containing protein n=1 Tax=Marivita sp. TaxID=2003365 RepID=UPI003F6B875A